MTTKQDFHSHYLVSEIVLEQPAHATPCASKRFLSVSRNHRVLHWHCIKQLIFFLLEIFCTCHSVIQLILFLFSHTLRSLHFKPH